MAKGFDYAFGVHPSPTTIKAAGGSFVLRYISSFAPNDSNGKNLLPSEAKSILASGLQLGVVVEEGANRMLGGRAAGVADAQHADMVVKALEMPGIPVYFACDFDASESNQAAINAYLDGAASVIGRDRVGLYGGYWPLVRASKAGKAKYFWQTRAWSGSNVPGSSSDLGGFTRNLYQGPTITLAGASVDVDYSFTTDFGQWPRPGGSGTSGSVSVPPIIGQSAGHAHNTLVAAGLVPTAPSGQLASDIATQANPVGGTVVDAGSHVGIVAMTVPVVKLNDTGEPVILLQTDLNKNGAGLTIDGNFGQVTDSAVRNFQSSHGLGVDGIVGPNTWAALGNL